MLNTNTIQIRDRLLRGIGASALGLLINAVGRLLLIPLFLTTWGAHAYGEWLILASLAAFISFGDLGAQSYFVNRLTNEWSIGAHEAFQRTLSTGMFFFIAVMLAVLMVAATVAIYLPIGPWFGVTAINGKQAYWVLVLSVAQLSISIPLGFVLGIYRALGKQATGVMFSNLIILVQLMVSASVLLAGAGLVEMAVYLIVGLVACIVVVVLDMHNRFKGDLIFCLGAVRIDILREGVSLSAHFFAAQLSLLMTVQGAVVIIGKLLGPTEVVLFTTIRTLMNFVRQLTGILHNMSWVEFTRLYASGNRRLFNKLYFGIFSSSMLIVVTVCALIIYFDNEISIFWLKDTVHLDSTIIRLMGISTVLSNVWMANLVLLMSINKHSEITRFQMIFGVTGLASLTGGAYFWGLKGAILGLIVGEGLPMVIASYFQVVKLSWLKAQKRNIVAIVATATFAAFCLISTPLTFAGIGVLFLSLYSVIATSHATE